MGASFVDGASDEATQGKSTAVVTTLQGRVAVVLYDRRAREDAATTRRRMKNSRVTSAAGAEHQGFSVLDDLRAT